MWKIVSLEDQHWLLSKAVEQAKETFSCEIPAHLLNTEVVPILPEYSESGETTTLPDMDVIKLKLASFGLRLIALDLERNVLVLKLK